MKSDLEKHLKQLSIDEPEVYCDNPQYISLLMRFIFKKSINFWTVKKNEIHMSLFNVYKFDPDNQINILHVGGNKEEGHYMLLVAKEHQMPNNLKKKNTRSTSSTGSPIPNRVHNTRNGPTWNNTATGILAETFATDDIGTSLKPNKKARK